MALGVLLVMALAAPGTVESCADLGSQAETLDCLDARGQEFADRSRYDEAADAFRAALRIDDGTHRFTWLARGEVVWDLRVGPGEGRHERAAKSLLAAGRKTEAREVLADLMSFDPSGWASDNGWAATGGGRVSGFDPEPTSYWGHPWFRPLPELEIPLMAGGTFALGSARGNVLLLDFWATWCPPCLKELPHLQTLYRLEHENGFTALAINADEPTDVALEAAASLGLEMPIGAYGEQVRSAFPFETLPVVIVADRRGRVRQRWDGYHPGMENAIARTVRDLLGDDPEGAPREIGRGVVGAGLLTLDWSREVRGVVGGMALLRGADGSVRIAASAGGMLHLLDETGELVAWQEASRIAGRLRSDGAGALVEFRSGGLDITVLDPGAGSSSTWQSPSPVLDVAVLPAAPPAIPEPRLVLATLGGVVVTDLRGETLREIEGIGEASEVEVTGATGRVLALDTGGRVVGFAVDGDETFSTDVPDGSWRLAVSNDPTDGWGVAPSSVVGAVVGRFLRGKGPHVAIATVSGQLLLADRATGEVVFRAIWPGITDLVATDPDGDGIDDLLVSSDRWVSRLRAGPPSAD